MNDKVKGLVLGLSLGVMLTGSIAYASGTQIEVYFKNIKYMFDGYEKNPTSEQGESFIYNGTTYVPLRYVSEALGKEVQWDGDTETIWLGKKVDLQVVVATYQGGQVTLGEFEKYKAFSHILDPENTQYDDNSNENFNSGLLKQLIGQQILVSRLSDELKQTAAVTTDAQIVKLNEFLQKYYDKEASATLAKNHLTEDDLRHYLGIFIGSQQWVESSVTDEKIKALYDQDVSSNNESLITAAVRHILINAKDEKGTPRTKEVLDQKLKEVQDKLKSGEDFAALAKQYSEDPGSKDNGGLYPDSPVTQWVEAFKKATITQELNKVGEPVQTEYGYHFIRVESRSTLPLESVKPQLKQQLLTEQYKQFNENELAGLIQKMDWPKP
jgi:foldase protein PrsA